MEDGKPLGLLQIECQCPLAAIGAEKKPAVAGQAQRKLAQHVALRRLDLDHRGAEIGEQRAAVRAGKIAAQIEDRDAAERTRCFPRHRYLSFARIAATFSKTRCAR
jgi:hypothetical protein